jgi:hypothetical protein
MSDEESTNELELMHYVKWRDTDEVIQQREDIRLWFREICLRHSHLMDPFGKEYLRVCIDLYKTPLSHRDDMHACKFDPNDYSLEFDDCGTAGWIESKEDTKKKESFWI